MLSWNCQINTFTMKEWKLCKCFHAFNTVHGKLAPVRLHSSAKHSNFERMSDCNRKLFYNRKRAVHREDGYNWTSVLIQYLWKRDDDCCSLFKKYTAPLEILDHCNWPPEIMMVSLKCMAASAPLETDAFNRNIYQIHCIYAIYGCKCSCKRYSIHIHWRMVGCNSFREITKHCTLKKAVPCH